MVEQLSSRHTRVRHEFRRNAIPPTLGQRCIDCEEGAPAPRLIHDGRCEEHYEQHYKQPRYRVAQPPKEPTP